MLGSSAQTDLTRSLAREKTLQEQGLANAALGQSRSLQEQVNQEYANLASQLQASVDPTTVMRQATTAASQFAAPTMVQPIGQLFSNWANSYLAAANSNAYNNYANQYLNYIASNPTFRMPKVAQAPVSTTG